MINLKNKKADERYLSPWLFLNWGIIGAMIVMGAFVFYGAQADVRLIESDIMATRILDCLNDDFSYVEMNSEGFDIYKKCNLDVEVLENSDKFYVSLSITDLQTGVKEPFSELGRKTFKEQCLLQFSEDKTEKNFAQCSKKELYVYDSKLNKDYLLSIISASNQE